MNEKPAYEPAYSYLHIRVRQSDKAAWVKAANRKARETNTTDTRGNLAGWVVDTLNAALKRNT